MQTELERANARAASGAEEWVERNKKLEKELEWARETADRLDRQNQGLQSENHKLRAQFKTQEDDREYLIRQLVAAKKDNARLRQDLAAAQDEIATTRRDSDERAEASARMMAGAGTGFGAAGGGPNQSAAQISSATHRNPSIAAVE